MFSRMKLSEFGGKLLWLAFLLALFDFLRIASLLFWVGVAVIVITWFCECFD